MIFIKLSSSLGTQPMKYGSNSVLGWNVASTKTTDFRVKLFLLMVALSTFQKSRRPSVVANTHLLSQTDLNLFLMTVENVPWQFSKKTSWRRGVQTSWRRGVHTKVCTKFQYSKLYFLTLLTPSIQTASVQSYRAVYSGYRSTGRVKS